MLSKETKEDVLSVLLRAREFSTAVEFAVDAELYAPPGSHVAYHASVDRGYVDEERVGEVQEVVVVSFPDVPIGQEQLAYLVLFPDHFSDEEVVVAPTEVVRVRRVSKTKVYRVLGS